jgi:nucleotide-binding universal stress UspA family protein
MTSEIRPMYRRILVYYDGTKTGKRAFRTALDLARAHDADLFVVCVALARLNMENVDDKSLADLSFHSQRKRLAALRTIATAERIRAHFEVLQGTHSEQLVQAADRHSADVIILGERQRSKLARMLLHSLPEQVKQRARQQVLVVR